VAFGLAAGLAITFLSRRNARRRGGPVARGIAAARRGMRRAGLVGWDGAVAAGRAAAESARQGVLRGRDYVDEMPVDEFGDEMRDYIDAAKGAFEDTVRGELRDLRRTMRRRRRLGV